MRGQLGPSLVPGNAPAARRLARARKPPPIILWSIGIITCLLFAGAAVMLAIGYLNPFGTIGLSILGVGAVVYFGAIIFLVLSCLWVERKYPGLQPLSFKFYSRKPQRPPPTAFVNPNFSGQTPQSTPSYRIHNETPSNVSSVTDIEEITENVPSGLTNPTQNKYDKQNGSDLPQQIFSSDHDNPSNAHQPLQNEGSEGVIKGQVPEDITIAETRNQEGDTSAITSENSAINKSKSNAPNDSAAKNTTVQNKNIPQSNQKGYNLAKTSSTQKEEKAQQKPHHQELPMEDYPVSENSTITTNNIKKSATENQGFKPKDNKQQSITSVEINPSHIAMAPSISTSQEQRTTMHQQKETHKDDVVGSVSTRGQQSTEKQSSSVLQTQQNKSQTVKTEIDRLFEKEQNAKDIFKTDNIQRKPAVRMRKPISKPQIQNIQDTLTPTDSALLADGRKPILHNEQDTVLQPSNLHNHLDSVMLTKTSPVIERKRVHFEEYHVQSVQSTKNLVKDNSKVYSVAHVNNALQHKNDGRHEHQNKPLTTDASASTKHFPQNLDFQGVLAGFTNTNKMQTPQRPEILESPERKKTNDPPDRAKPELPARVRKQQSPERARKPESPGSARKQESPERMRKPESPERMRKPESPERGRKLRIDHRLSQSPPNVRKIVSSSSPTRNQNISPKAQRNKDNTSAVTNLSKEEIYRRQNYHSSPSSQSSDLPSSSSSSPPRHHKRSPDSSPKHQFHASGNTDFYSNARNEKRHERHPSPSSYSSDVPSSTSSSPQSHRRKDPDISNKVQRQKDNPTVSSRLSPNAKIDDLNKRPSQQSSQFNDITLSPTMSAKKLLQYKPNHGDLYNSTRSPHTRDPSSQTFVTTGEYKHQTKHQNLDKSRTSSHSREVSPTAARTTSPSNKRFPENPREDKT